MRGRGPVAFPSARSRLRLARRPRQRRPSVRKGGGPGAVELPAPFPPGPGISPLHDRERTLESTRRGHAIEPEQWGLIGFKATTLREFDPGNAEILPLARRWVERKPKDGSARFFLSDELAKAGDVDSAIEQARAAIDLRPEGPLAPSPFGRPLGPQVAVGRRRWRRSTRRSCSSPSAPRTTIFAARSSSKWGSSKQARTASDEATRCEDTVPWHFHLLGHIRASLGDHAAPPGFREGGGPGAVELPAPFPSGPGISRSSRSRADAGSAREGHTTETGRQGHHRIQGDSVARI